MLDRRISLFTNSMLCFVIIGGCSDASGPSPSGLSDQERAASLEELRTAVDTFYNAWYDSDWDLYYSFYADDVVLIDSSGDHMSLDEYNAKAAQQTERIGSVITDQLHKNLVPTIRVGPNGDAGVAYWTLPFEYQKADGTKTTINWAESDVWWKIDGEWKAVLIHFHAITNSDPSSG